MTIQRPTDGPKQLILSPTATQWYSLLSQFEPIGLAQMDGVALLDRIDTKYVLTARQLYNALTLLTEHYWVLDINHLRVTPYQTLYFDTANFTLYLHHHDGVQNRYKVRRRTYVDTGQSFLEVKCKIDENRTVKNRMPTPGLLTWFPPETSDFMKAHFPLNPQSLEPKLWNDFSRITLISKYQQERLTLDLYLQFCTVQQTIALAGLAVAEVKQDGVNHNSDFMWQMRAMNIHPTRFSKYCVGISMLYQNIKHNNFNAQLRLVQKLIRGDYNV